MNLPARLEHALVQPDRGVLGMVEELLATALQREVRLDWVEGRCHVSLSGGGTSEEFAVALPRAVVRASLARIAALCNDRKPDSVSPYGGRGELTVDADPPVIIQVTFLNTPENQSLELGPRESSPRTKPADNVPAAR